MSGPILKRPLIPFLGLSLACTTLGGCGPDGASQVAPSPHQDSRNAAERQAMREAQARAAAEKQAQQREAELADFYASKDETDEAATPAPPPAPLPVETTPPGSDKQGQEGSVGNTVTFRASGRADNQDDR